MAEPLVREEVTEISAALKRLEARKKRKPMLLTIAAAIVIAVIAAFFLFPIEPPLPIDTCLNGVQDSGEEGVDCGGVCPTACLVVPPVGTCSNGVQDSDEEGIDCGGVCPTECPPVQPYVDPAHVLPTSVSDISIDLANNRIYVLDEMRHRIMVYDSEFSHLENFGETREERQDGGWDYYSGGIGNDKLLFPASVYAANNKLYVLDRGKRVQVFGPELVFERTLSFSADAIEKLPKIEDTPNTDGGVSSIAVSDSGKIYVADEVSNSIAVFDSQLSLIKAIGPGEFDYSVNMPRQIALGPTGKLFVADSANSRVQVFDSELNFEKSITENLLMPVGVAIASYGKTFVLDNADSKLKVFDSEGNFIEEVGGLGEDPLNFYNQRAVKLDSQGKIYVVEEGNNRIQVLDEQLNFVKAVEGIKDDFSVSFAPFYPAISPNGDIAVSDPINSKVFVLGSDFKLKKTLGGKGFGNDEFNTPKGLAFDSAGKLFVSDSGNRRVQVFSPGYEYLRTITHANLIWPLAISVSEEGKVFVVDDKHKKVMIFDQQGSLIGEIGEQEGITLPLGLLAKDGKVYITDDKEKTIEIFDAELNKLQSVADIDASVGAHVEFNESLAIDGKGRLLFCDNRNRSVVAFDLSTESFSTFGRFGSSVLELSILEVAATAELTVIADMEQHRVKFFDADEKQIKEITVNNLR